MNGLTELLGTVHPIRGGGEDAAGIAGSLAAGVQAPERGLAGPIPWDAHWGGGTALHRRQDGVRIVVAPELLPQQGERPGNGIRHEGRQAPAQVRPARKSPTRWAGAR